MVATKICNHLKIYELKKPMDIKKNTEQTSPIKQNCCNWLYTKIKESYQKASEFIKSHKKEEIKKRKEIEINQQLDVLNPTIFYQLEEEKNSFYDLSDSPEQNEFYQNNLAL